MSSVFFTIAILLSACAPEEEGTAVNPIATGAAADCDPAFRTCMDSGRPTSQCGETWRQCVVEYWNAQSGREPLAFESNASVSRNGVAQVGIPIQVPAGVQSEASPHLALSYASGAGDGYLGRGFAVAGLSSLSRCPRTEATDGERGRIDLGALDRLCLDGARLVADGNYWANRTHLRTEVEQRLDVVRVSADSYTVSHPDGSISYYGHDRSLRGTSPSLDSSNAVVHHFGNPVEWALSRRVDAFGNVVDYHYDLSNGERTIREIMYGGNTRARTAHHARVVFGYEDRTGALLAYFGGAPRPVTKQLSSITTYAGDTPLLTYSLRYRTIEATSATGASGAANPNRLPYSLQLEEVSLCAGADQPSDANSHCAQSTRFEWTDTSIDVVESEQWVADGSLVDMNRISFAVRAACTEGDCFDLATPVTGRRVAADFNGDGRIDLGMLQIDGPDNTVPYFRYYVSNGEEFEPAGALRELPQVTHDFGDGPHLYMSIPRMSGDFNCDGKTDLLAFGEHADLLPAVIYYGTGSGFEEGARWTGNSSLSPAHEIVVLDLNGDGCDEIVVANREEVYSPPSDGSGFSNDQSPTALGVDWPEDLSLDDLIVGDYDGDGRADLLYLEERDALVTDANVFLSEGLTLGPPRRWGDGAPDFAIMTMEGAGATIDFRYGNPNLAYLDQRGLYAGDFNADGLDDLLFQSLQNDNTIALTVWLSTGSRFDRSNASWGQSDVLLLSPSNRAIDFNGDGRADLTGIALDPSVPLRSQGVGSWRDPRQDFQIRLSAGRFGEQAFGAPAVWSVAGEQIDVPVIGDFRGLGRPQVLALHDEGGGARGATLLGGPPGSYENGVLTGVTNGLGRDLRFRYLPMNHPSALYEEVDWIENPTYTSDLLVYELSSPSPQSGRREVTRFRRSEYRRYNDGRGAAGFLLVDEQDLGTGVHTITEYSQGWPTIGMVSSIWETAASNRGSPPHRYRLVRYQSAAAPNAADSGAVVVWESERTEGVQNGATRQTAAVSVDDWGFITESTTTTFGPNPHDPDEAAVESVHRTHIDYEHRTSGTWRLGLATGRVELHDGSEVRRTCLQYDSLGAVRESATALPRDPAPEADSPDYFSCEGDKLVETVQGNARQATDLFGNAIRTEVRPAARIAADSHLHFAPRVETRRFDASGVHLLSDTNAEGQEVQTLAHAPNGRPSVSLDADGRATLYVYDPFGRLVRTSRLGVGQQVEVCACTGTNPSRLTTYCANIQCPSDAVTASVRRATADADGNRAAPVTYEYRAAAGHVVAHDTELALGSRARVTSQYEEDDDGSLVLRVSLPHDPARAPSRFRSETHDRWGRVVRQREPVPTAVHASGYAQTTMSYNGLTVTVTGPNGHTTVTRHDPRGGAAYVEDEAGFARHIEYDGFQRTRRVWYDRDDGSTNEWVYSYSPEGFLSALNDPDQGLTVLKHDLLGQLRERTDAVGNVRRLSYDRLGRLTDTTIESADGSPTIEYTTVYDPANGTGAAASVTMESGGTQVHQRRFSFDERGRLRTVNESFQGSVSGVTTISYNAFAQPTTIEHASGVQECFRYAPNGAVLETGFEPPTGHNASLDNLAEFSDSDSACGYRTWQLEEENLRGDTTEETFGNGMQIVSQFEPERGLLTQRTYGSENRTLRSLSLEYRRDGRIHRRLDESLDETFHYTPRGELRSIDRGGRTASSANTYLPNGNILSRNEFTEYSYGSGRPHAPTSLSERGGAVHTFQYDDAGNRIEHRINNTPIWVGSYDGRGQLRHAENSSGRVSFIYDVDQSRLVQTQEHERREDTVRYFGRGVEHRTRGSNTEWATPLAGGAMFIDPDSGNDRVVFEVSDHLQSVTAIAGADGELEELRSYDASGRRRNSSSGALSPAQEQEVPNRTTRRGFAGHVEGLPGGIVHMTMRAYDPVTGLFIAPDPVVDGDHARAMNAYLYVHNDPINFRDPNGAFTGQYNGFLASGAEFLSSSDAGAGGGAAWGTAFQNGNTNPDNYTSDDTDDELIQVQLDVVPVVASPTPRGIGFLKAAWSFIKGLARGIVTGLAVAAVVAVAPVLGPIIAVAGAALLTYQVVANWRSIRRFGQSVINGDGITEAEAETLGSLVGGVFVGGITSGGRGIRISTPRLGRGARTRAGRKDRVRRRERERQWGDGAQQIEGTNYHGWDREITGHDVKALGDQLIEQNPGRQLHILSGTHGGPDGRLDPDVGLRPFARSGGRTRYTVRGQHFLFEDINAFGNGHSNVRVYDVTRMSLMQIRTLINSGDPVIGSFCYSSRWHVVN